jgi:hypothetical protein
MGLIEEFRALKQDMPPSHVPSSSESASMVGQLIAYVEFGDKFIDAANDDDPQKLADLLGGVESVQPAKTAHATTSKPN